MGKTPVCRLRLSARRMPTIVIDCALRTQSRKRQTNHTIPAISLSAVASQRKPLMQTRKQVTVFLENKPGRLAQVLSSLAHKKINIVAQSVMDRHEHGVLRLVTED